MKMHDGQFDLNADLVSELVRDQFPGLGDLPVRAAPSTGTVNAVYRIGDQAYARLPLLPGSADDLEREQRCLEVLDASLALRIPRIIGRGIPSSRFPHPWAIYDWIDGEPYDHRLLRDEAQAARDLGQFVLELRGVPNGSDAPPAGRRPLRELDTQTRGAINAAGRQIDRRAAIAAWARALDAPPATGAPTWIHSDLLPPNVLVRQRRICAVIDFGGAGVGDPAADVIAAWTMFGPTGRDVFRAVLGVDDGTWERSRGYALHQAAAIIPYYRETNPAFVAMAQRTVREILAESAPV